MRFRQPEIECDGLWIRQPEKRCVGYVNFVHAPFGNVQFNGAWQSHTLYLRHCYHAYPQRVFQAAFARCLLVLR